VRHRSSGVSLISKESLKQRLDKDKIIDGDHWLWAGACDKDSTGYGVIRIDGKKFGVHRISAFAYLGLDLNDHDQHALHKPECHNRLCFNPEHLYIGTNADNRQDRADIIRASSHYPCGHPRTIENSIKSDPPRCLVCHNKRCNDFYHKRTTTTRVIKTREEIIEEEYFRLKEEDENR
jgi:hypothetical protein